MIKYAHHFNHIDDLVQEKRNSIANALELRLSGTDSLMCGQPFTIASHFSAQLYCGQWQKMMQA